VKLATEKQKNKMRDLGIAFCEDITLDEAREALAEEQIGRVDEKRKVAGDIHVDCLSLPGDLGGYDG